MNNNLDNLKHIINEAIKLVPNLEPTTNFVATNPLNNLEDKKFYEAIKFIKRYFPNLNIINDELGNYLLKKSHIKTSCLETVLGTYDISLDDFLNKDNADSLDIDNKENNNKILHKKLLVKYLTLFLDEGHATIEMPFRKEGFYTAVLKLIVNDPDLDINPADVDYYSTITSLQLVDFILNKFEVYSDIDKFNFISAHIVDLFGWSGFIKWRESASEYEWQKHYPITINDFLAIKLLFSFITNDDKSVYLSINTTKDKDILRSKIWLEALELTHQDQLKNKLYTSFSSINEKKDIKAQFIFCIDVRSGAIRNQLEEYDYYQTFGSAGFFGLPISYEKTNFDLSVNSCPAILTPKYKIPKISTSIYEKFTKILKSLKSDALSSLLLSEIKGGILGALMLKRTVAGNLQRENILQKKYDEIDVNFIPLEEQKEIALNFLKSIGLTKNISEYVFVCGHGADALNNHFVAALDCGACGGNKGDINAIVLCTILNSQEVKEYLMNNMVDVNNTKFIPAQHNTSSNTLDIFTNDISLVPEFIINDLSDVFGNLKRDSNLNWADIQPELGLANNSTFFIGKSYFKDVDNRVFMHSYNSSDDSHGVVLSSILAGPLTVASGINLQYFFSSVAHDTYGSGTKSIHNIICNSVVITGDDLDLKHGLPLQSVFNENGELIHIPLRLNVIIEAPIELIEKCFVEIPNIRNLILNEWVHLYSIQDSLKKFNPRTKIWDFVDNISLIGQKLHNQLETA